MNYRGVVKRLIQTLIGVVILVGQTHGGAQQKATNTISQDMAVETLRHYLELRLCNASWKTYSKLITWADEPSWDCTWVVSQYDIGVAKKVKRNVVVPVVYKRLGLFCYDFQFNLDPKIVTINYELVRYRSAWKVNAPIPDYPDISADVLIKSLRASSDNLRESPERRFQFKIVAHELADALDGERGLTR